MVFRILITIALLFSSVAMSQDENGLTFNQVLLVDIENEVTVPEGKVWKFTGYIANSTSDGNYLIINDNYRYFNRNQSPLWFPELTRIRKSNDFDGADISVIEFNTD